MEELKQFELDKKYKNLCLIYSPNGIIEEGTILTGNQWRNVLVFDIGHGFDTMFEEITATETK